MGTTATIPCGVLVSDICDICTLLITCVTNGLCQFACSFVTYNSQVSS